MADLSYANDDAIDQIGVLDKYDKDHDHPEGYSRAIIDKIEHDMDQETHHGENNVPHDMSQYTEDERAVWDWYRKDVVDQDHWKKLVEEYEKDAAAKNKTDIHAEKFDESHQYVPKVGSDFKPPAVSEYSGSDNKSHKVAVSTEALEYFAKELDQVAGDGHGMLLDAHKKLDGIDMRPGAFAKAELLRQTIIGTGSKDLGLRGDTMNVLQTVHEALFTVKESVRAMIKEYDSGEEFQRMSVDQLNDAMEGAWGKIDKIKDYGSGEGTTSGGDA
ncbi:hypothetical protein [Micromonospora sp. NPDC005367]|uniref:hypothetical protein n=1 Tax=Micromonospora sp. NPDC005367 TaxID=3155590 RepID=UPI0033BACBB6